MTIISGKYEPPKPTFIGGQQLPPPPKVENGKMVIWKVIPLDQDGIPYESTGEEVSFVISGVGYLKKSVWLSGIGFDPDVAFDYLNHWSESYETMLEPETWVYLVETLSSDMESLDLKWFSGYQICELDHDSEWRDVETFLLAATPRSRVPVSTVRVGIHFPVAEKPIRFLDLLRPPTYAFEKTLKNAYPPEKIYQTLMNAEKQPTMKVDMTLIKKTPLDKRS